MTQKKPDFEFKIKLSGEYRVLVKRGDGTEHDTGWFPNLVLNQGLDRMGNTAASLILANCSVGTGNTTPAAGQTGLTTFLANKAAPSTGPSGTSLGASTYKYQIDASYVFTTGAVVGNIAEVGVGWSATNGNLFSRALILDLSLLPTTIAVTALDQLTVFYRLTMTPPLTDISGNVTISAISYPYVGRIAAAAAFMANFASQLATGSTLNGFGSIFVPSSGFATYGSTSPAGCTIGSTTSNGPSGTNTTFTSSTASVSPAAYSNGSYYRDSTITLQPAAGNSAGGIGGMTLGFIGTNGNSAPGVSFQYVFSTPIPKDATKTLTMTFRMTWSR